VETIPELRFKGGTSLSKVFSLIDRFSEDIDISINRGSGLFRGTRSREPTTLRQHKRKALGEELGAAITGEVNSKVLAKLHDRFEAFSVNRDGSSHHPKTKTKK
jgi:Nucleotidyl transferase AbiEii toxin, Type IV TA system